MLPRWYLVVGALIVVAFTAPAQAEGTAAGELPWVAFARVLKAPPTTEAKLAEAVSRSLLRSEVNVVDGAELAKAADHLGVPRTRWADVGALNEVAVEIGADYLLFASVRSGELELFTLSRAGELGGAERVALGRRGAPPVPAELDQALARLLAKLPRHAPADHATGAALPVPPPAASEHAQGTPPASLADHPVAAASPPVPANLAAGASEPTPALQLGMYLGAGALGIGGAGALIFGVFMGADAMAQSDALLILPKESPQRVERERAALDTAALADVGYASAVLLIGAAVGVAVWAAVLE